MCKYYVFTNKKLEKLIYTITFFFLHKFSAYEYIRFVFNVFFVSITFYGLMTKWQLDLIVLSQVTYSVQSSLGLFAYYITHISRTVESALFTFTWIPSVCCGRRVPLRGQNVWAYDAAGAAFKSRGSYRWRVRRGGEIVDDRRS